MSCARKGAQPHPPVPSPSPRHNHKSVSPPSNGRWGRKGQITYGARHAGYEGGRGRGSRPPAGGGREADEDAEVPVEEEAGGGGVETGGVRAAGGGRDPVGTQPISMRACMHSATIASQPSHPCAHRFRNHRSHPFFFDKLPRCDIRMQLASHLTHAPAPLT